MKKLFIFWFAWLVIMFPNFEAKAMAKNNLVEFRKPVESIRHRLIPKKEFTHGAGDYRRKLRGEFRSRYYEMHVPPAYDKKSPAPVVMVFHGGGGDPGSVRYSSRMDSTSDKHGFIAVYPAGTPTRSFLKDRLMIWNDGRPFKDGQHSEVDDVAYVDALLADLSTLFNVDEKRIYVCGYSNGAQFAYRLAKRRPDVIAAIAAVAGPRKPDDDFDPAPARPLPVMQFAGIQDNFSPYKGGKPPQDATFKAEVKPVREVVKAWADFNKCQEKPVEEKRVGQAVMRRYGNCRAGAEVVFWTLEDAGHTWPGGRVSPNAEVLGLGSLGKVNQDINAAELMWEFFKKHPLP